LLHSALEKCQGIDALDNWHSEQTQCGPIHTFLSDGSVKETGNIVETLTSDVGASTVLREKRKCVENTYLDQEG